MGKIKIKNEHFFKNRTQMIVYIILFIILFCLFIFIGKQNYNEELPDNERFASEFSMVNNDNIFSYVTASKAYMAINNGDGIILFGTKNEWVNYYAYIINKVAKEVGIKEIYYYDFIKNRQDNNGTYESIVEKLSNYVTYNDRGKAEIYAPTLLVIKDGNVLLFDTDTTFIEGNVTPSVYWNSFTTGEKEQELKTVFNEYLGK